MKKIVASMLIMLVSMVALSKTPKDRHHFIVEGSFLSDKNVTYTIFKENGSGAFVSVEHIKARKYYYVECDPGHRYIIRFQNKKGNVKFLMIDASTYGYFQADVDWNKSYDGLIKKEKIGYCLTPIANGNRPVLLAQN